MAHPIFRFNSPWNALRVRTPHDLPPSQDRRITEAAKDASSAPWISSVIDGIDTVLQHHACIDAGAVLLLCLQGAAAFAMAITHTQHPTAAALPDHLSLALMIAESAAAISLLPALLALLNPAAGATRIVIGVAQALMLLLLVALPDEAIEIHWRLARSFMASLLLIDWIAIVTVTAVYVFTGTKKPADGSTANRGYQTERRREKILAAKLRKAIAEGGLTLAYQPIFSGNTMVAVEALARWNDPQEGFISPAEFIPVAEETGLIIPFSDWVLREACGQMVRWLACEPHPERIAVNVSVKHVWRGDFVPTVERILAETGLAPHCLELELTESSLVADFDTVKNHLTALRSIGVRISIDDFGTGYSSLNRVRELDADTLKVDRLFVQAATESANGLAVVQAIIDMAHSLKLSVVAEGVETQEQVTMLRAMHCDEMQGFLLARPQTAEALTSTLRNPVPFPHIQSTFQLHTLHA